MTNPPIGPPVCVPLKTWSGEWSYQVNAHGPLHHSYSYVVSSLSDFGFERVNLNSPCTPLPYLSWPPPPPTNCPEGGNYSYTSGSAPSPPPPPNLLSSLHVSYGCHSVRDLTHSPSPLPFSPAPTLPLPPPLLFFSPSLPLIAIARWQGTAVSLVVRPTFYRSHGPVQSVHPRVCSSPTPWSSLPGKV